MKHILLTLLLGTVALGLMAQTGLHGISFGQARQELTDALKSQGFQVYEDGEWRIRFSSQDPSKISEIFVYFKDEKVDYWNIFYDLMDDYDYYEAIEERLIELHGKPEDETLFSSIWCLENGYAVMLEYDLDEGDLIIIHYSRDYNDLVEHYYEVWW